MRSEIFLHRIGIGAVLRTGGLIAGGLIATVICAQSSSNPSPAPAPAPPTVGAPTPATSRSTVEPDTVKLTDSQLGAIRTAAVAVRDFQLQKTTVGNIDFNEDRTAQIFTPYPGRIIEAFPKLGEAVRRGEVLFTVESPDFIAAQSNLISAAATLDQTRSALRRARDLYTVKGIDQNDYETAIANEYSAEGALRAARNAVATFGKTEPQIDQIIASRHVETALLIRSPMTGTVTARNAAPGLLEQPGNAPAPYTISDLSTVWMLANVTETDSPGLKRGQVVAVTLSAFPGRVFVGTIDAVAVTVDPNSRRVTVRSVIDNPTHELLPQMFGTFVIRTGSAQRAAAVPLNGVVREGDGTMSVWVVGGDPHVFKRRQVRIGEQQDGYDEVLDGIAPGERVAVDGAIFLSNILYGGAS